MISVSTLTKYAIFTDLNKALLEELASIGEEITVQKNEWLFYENDEADSLYLIIAGEIELKLGMELRRNLYMTLKTLAAGDTLGWSSMIAPYKYKLGATAVSPSLLIKFNGQQLRSLLMKYPEDEVIVMERITQAISTRLSVVSERAPALSCRLTGAILLFGLGLFLAIAVLAYGIYAATNQTEGPEAIIGSVVFCMILPILMIVLAYFVNPSNNALDKRLSQVRKQSS